MEPRRKSSRAAMAQQLVAGLICLVFVCLLSQPVALSELEEAEQASNEQLPTRANSHEHKTEQVPNSNLVTGVAADANSRNGELDIMNADLDLGASELSVITQTSFKIEAFGWPSTSPMWPSIQTDGVGDDQPESTASNERRRLNVVEPFIYADNPRTKDYSLMLVLNETLLDLLRNHTKPMAVNLSFEYYFNHGPDVTALPALKVEVDRNQIKRLEPGGQGVKAKMWMKFNEQISITDPAQLKNHDWLKFSLINRMSPSLVAIRRLKVEFLMPSSSALLKSPSLPQQTGATSAVTQQVGGHSSATMYTPAAVHTPATVHTPAAVHTPATVHMPPAMQHPAINPPEAALLATPTTSQYVKQVPTQQVSEASPQQHFDAGHSATQFAFPTGLPQSATIANDQHSPGGRPVNHLTSPTEQAGPYAAGANDHGLRPIASHSVDLPHTDPSATSNAHPSSPAYTGHINNGDVAGSKDFLDGRSATKVKIGPAEKHSAASENIETAVSDVLGTEIKPVEQKSSGAGWSNWGGRRRKREVTYAGDDSEPKSIVLTCFMRDQCDWKADGGEEIQWSLARMPPSTDIVKSGYYYVSNLNNYGDPAKMLRISLNQTDSATVGDQNSEHCIEVALYVTERSYLKLYRLNRIQHPDSDSNSLDWAKDNLILTWAPTVASSGEPTSAKSGLSGSGSAQIELRSSLPNAKLAAIEGGQSGWTVETLCFGDFFVDPRKCGAGKCAFGFRMESLDDALKQQQSDGSPTSLDQSLSNTPDQSQQQQQSPSTAIKVQVVGVALLREYAINKPLKIPQNSTWFQTWQRNDTEPSDNWHFYPNLDYKVGKDNVNLVNLYDDAHYHIESDWLKVSENLELKANLAVQTLNDTYLNENIIANITKIELQRLQQEQLETLSNDNNNLQPSQETTVPDYVYAFKLNIQTKLVDSNYNPMHVENQTIAWPLKNITSAQIELDLQVTESIKAARQGQLQRESMGDDDSIFKIVLEFVLDSHWTSPGSALSQFLLDNKISYSLSLNSVSLSDRCFPSPCEPNGDCKQNGTGPEDWECTCDSNQKPPKSHRGRRCEFGNWCKFRHVLPWSPSAQHQVANGAGGIVLQVPNKSVTRQAKLSESEERISGDEYCKLKLGDGFKCTDLEERLDDKLYTEDGKTFDCSCQPDHYLSDDSKCRRAHLCSSIVCPSIGMICDESKPFNHTQPCHCNEKQDWFHDPSDPDTNKCVRRQCHDRWRDCQFDAHICLPTLPGEKPICKCGPKFTLRKNDKGQLECQSTACVLPSLNDCDQICKPNNNNLERPYTCECHKGFRLDTSNNHACLAERPRMPRCNPPCIKANQICTDEGCKCKQGFISEDEIVEERLLPSNGTNESQQTKQPTLIKYIKSVKCLNICSLTSVERGEEESDKIHSVCPLRRCDPESFQCICSDPDREALINTKYEPIYANLSSSGDSTQIEDASKERERISPLCRLRRVCEQGTKGYQTCRGKGAICVPDYKKKPEMFDCVCPPSTEKKIYGLGATSNDFTCESKCSAKRHDCLIQQAVCKLIDKDQVRCDCLPGFMFDQHAGKCYLAKYSYSFHLIIVNKYYEPESKFHRLEVLQNSTSTQTTGDQSTNNGNDQIFDLYEGTNKGIFNYPDRPPFQEIVPQFSRIISSNRTTTLRSMFITDYNQCNITQVIPKDIIEDYEHDIESFFSYINQCNERIHQNARNYHLNSRLSEDLRQSLRQHLIDFSVTTSNSSCVETDLSGAYLNCTVYLQSNEPIPESTVDFVFNNCDKNGKSDEFCWIKPRLLLKKPSLTFQPNNINSNETRPVYHTELNFHQVIPCEIENFCGDEAYSIRGDNTTSLCSCKCPPDVHVIDARELDQFKSSVKQTCTARDRCKTNSIDCSIKPHSVCHYDPKTGISRCICKAPFYENIEGACVEVTFYAITDVSKLIIVLLAIALFISIAVNLGVIAKPKKLFGRTRQYPLNEFPTSRPANRSTGVPNNGFVND